MELKVFSLGSNNPLAEKIAGELRNKLGSITISRFADGETYVQFNENLRERRVFLIQPTNQPDRNLFCLLAALDAVCRAGGKAISVIPYFGYARQDRKSAPREPITARLVMDLIETSGSSGILAMDLHANQEEGFASRRMKLDQIYARPVFLDLFRDIFKTAVENGHLVIGSPDASGAGPGRARAYAKHLGNRFNLDQDIPLIIVDKRREEHNQSDVMHILGDVEGKTVVFVDDILDTGGTLIKAAEAVKKAGAVEVFAAITHGVLSKNAVRRIDDSVMTKVFITDSIYNRKIVGSKKIEIISVARIFAEAIRSIHTGESVSRLFN
ncbi:MAG: ribose-phosphate diphosphokinase [Candidatus Yanofskybacteria bacterium]|nr:ribose-phosphate diphosphokinase [Candidatus Yanofskybacteria bacterium]